MAVLKTITGHQGPLSLTPTLMEILLVKEEVIMVAIHVEMKCIVEVEVHPSHRADPSHLVLVPHPITTPLVQCLIGSPVTLVTLTVAGTLIMDGALKTGSNHGDIRGSLKKDFLDLFTHIYQTRIQTVFVII